MGSDTVVVSRKAEFSDWRLIDEIEGICFNKHDRLKPRQIKWYLRNPMGSVLVDLIEIQPGNKSGKPESVGWASYFTRKNSRNIRLYSICILPEYSGKGFARSYLEMKFGILRHDFKTMSLEVRKSNFRAVQLYKNLGFEEKHSLPGYYPDGEHGIKMIKRL